MPYAFAIRRRPAQASSRLTAAMPKIPGPDSGAVKTAFPPPDPPPGIGVNVYVIVPPDIG
jgi:hypothetical protein